MGYAFTEFHIVDLLRLARWKSLTAIRPARKCFWATLTIVFLA